MIVPRNPLLAVYAGLLVPAAIVAALSSDFRIIGFLIIGLVVLACLLDAVRAFTQLDGLHVQLDDSVRFFKDREGPIPVRFQHTAPHPRDLRFGLPLPAVFRSDQTDLAISLPVSTQALLVQWPATPLQRGQYQLDRCYVEAASPFGFWALRRAFPVSCELRVYPNLLADAKRAASFLNRGLTGVHLQRQVGQGREFDKLREYLPGDDFGEIHWKATARKGKPITKVFQVEKTQEIYVIVDASRLTARPTALSPEPLLERYVNTALLLGLAAERQGDLFGLVTFSDRVESFVRARNGKAHYSACRDALYTLQPKLVTPDFDELFTFLRLRLSRRALLVFLTELDDHVLAEAFQKRIGLLRKHLIVAGMIRPEDARPVFANPQIKSLDDVYAELGGQMRLNQLRELEGILRRGGVRFYLFEPETLAHDLTIVYQNIKQRQLL